MTYVNGGIMKQLRIFAILLLVTVLVTGCGYSGDMIDVVSREDGSGTRGAFSEIFKITQKQDDGTVLDSTYDNAEVTNSTAVVMLTVSEDKNAIGYISMGSLNDSVKAVDINGVAPTAENVKNGTYEVSRPFLIDRGTGPGKCGGGGFYFVYHEQRRTAGRRGARLRFF